MKIHVLTFGVINEIISDNNFEVESACTVLQLRNYLNTHHTALKELPYLIAVNNAIAPEQLILDAEDEIALLPPFSGG
ncbi:MAG: MoaD/ThiS family protein [Chitinophagales bacterium]|nr:MoaD/ThiS family protein [Chitinophagales bacterium]MBP9705836.1 MoaD/ThiS family protein [Chitinophagales bacterium]